MYKHGIRKSWRLRKIASQTTQLYATQSIGKWLVDDRRHTHPNQPQPIPINDADDAFLCMFGLSTSTRRQANRSYITSRTDCTEAHIIVRTKSAGSWQSPSSLCASKTHTLISAHSWVCIRHTYIHTNIICLYTDFWEYRNNRFHVGVGFIYKPNREWPLHYFHRLYCAVVSNTGKTYSNVYLFLQYKCWCWMVLSKK